MSGAVLDLSGISFAYPGRPEVLRDLSLHLHEGEKVGLVGPNGCGKTTLLRLLVGLAAPTAGTIRILGREARTEKDFQAVRREVGLVFQHADDQLFCPTVLEDVAFGPLNLGFSAREARETAEKTLADLGLSGFGDRPSYRLSGGEKRLVALASVLAMRPRVLLLDEPTTGLDADTKVRLIDIMKGLSVTVLTVSHEPGFLSRVSERLLLLRDGRIREGGAVVHTHTHVHDLGDVPHDHNHDHHHEHPAD